MEVLNDVLMETVPLITVFGTAAIGSITACVSCKLHDRKIAKKKALAKAKAAKARAAKRAKQAELARQRKWRADWDAYFKSEVALMEKETAPSASNT